MMIQTHLDHEGYDSPLATRRAEALVTPATFVAPSLSLSSRCVPHIEVNDLSGPPPRSTFVTPTTGGSSSLSDEHTRYGYTENERASREGNDMDDGRNIQTQPILLVEDTLTNQRLGLLQLKRLGYQAEAVSSGREAVTAVAQGRYTLVLMDCMMPEMDGFEATTAIRQQELETGTHIPIIALTASAMRGDRQKCFDAGMDDSLSKPVRMEDLCAMLERWSTTTAT
jgi:CheY-like chemotaxis protein